MKAGICAIIAFIAVSLCGLFIAWIGGVQPFTGAAGLAAFITVSMAAMAAAIVYGEWRHTP